MEDTKNWEVVPVTNGPKVQRLKVDGGWLHRIGGGGHSACFVPNPEETIAIMLSEGMQKALQQFQEGVVQIMDLESKALDRNARRMDDLLERVRGLEARLRVAERKD